MAFILSLCKDQLLVKTWNLFIFGTLNKYFAAGSDESRIGCPGINSEVSNRCIFWSEVGV